MDKAGLFISSSLGGSLTLPGVTEETKCRLNASATYFGVVTYHSGELGCSPKAYTNEILLYIVTKVLLGDFYASAYSFRGRDSLRREIMSERRCNGINLEKW